MAVERLQLVIDQQTRGTDEVNKLADAVNKLNSSIGKTQKASDDGQKGLSSLASGFDVVKASVAALLGSEIIQGIRNLVQGTSDAAEQMINMADRTGLALGQVDRLQASAKIAGINIFALENSSRLLSQALEDTSENGTKAKRALAELGVQTNDATGSQREMGQVMLESIERLSAIQDRTKQTALATQLLGRGAVELLPLIRNYRELDDTARELGFGMRDNLIKELARANDEIDKLGLRWDILKGQLAVPIVAIVDVVFRTLDNSEMTASKASDQLREFSHLADVGFDSYLATRLGSKNERVQMMMRQQAGAATAGLKITVPPPGKGKPGAPGSPFVVNPRASTRFGTPSLFGAPRFFGDDGAPVSGTFMAKGLGGSAGDFLSTAPIEARAAAMERMRQASLQAIQSETDYQARKLQLMTGPSGEIAAVRAITQLRLDALEKERDLTENQFELDARRIQIVRDGELQILAIQKAREESAKQAGSQIFDAITAGGGGLKNYISGYGLGIGRTLFSNTYALAAKNLTGALSLPGQGTADKPTMLGKILSGTPFGLDPMKAAASTQLTAAQIQLGAAQVFAGAVTGSAAMGGLSGGLGGVTGGLGKAFGGLGVAGAPSFSMASNSGLSSAFGGLGLAGAPMIVAPKSGLSGMTKGVGIAGAAAAGAFGAYSGFSAGGAQGALTGAGSIAGAAGSIMMLAGLSGPAAPIVAGIGLALMATAALLGDPKQKRSAALEREANARRYQDPVGADYAADIYGRATDYNRYGQTRINLTVNALDSKSIIDRQEDIGEAVRRALDSYPPVATAVRNLAVAA
jgi:hypothetical protein